MDREQETRDYLKKYLDWREAHADLKSALRDFPESLRGKRPAGVPYSAWELLEHMRIATHDILEFSRDAKYKSPDWPSGYWPEKPEPLGAAAWDRSVKALEHDLDEMRKLVSHAKTDLHAKIPHGSGQTVFREALLIADHNAYHLGQFVLLRRLLGCWPDR
ncbi:MAG: DinB family protein [Acidobacteriota bacterium]|nr:DinB family protein [Acidobacteriota bacterium]